MVRTVCFRFFALYSSNLCSKIRTRRDTKQALKTSDKMVFQRCPVEKLRTMKGIIILKRKKIAIAVMAAFMSLTVACGNEDNGSSTDVSPSSTEAESTAPQTTESEDSSETTTTENEDSSETSATEASGADETTPAENPYGSTADINDYISSKEIDPPLWKVTDPDSGNEMYLLGTIHMLPADVSDYPADLMDVYNGCDSIAVEYDISALQSDVNAQMEFVNGMIYTDGTTIKDHISEETYNKAKDYFDSIGAYNEMLDQYTAGYWINQLSSVMLLRLENMDLSGTDAYFISKAQEDSKEVISIEELSMQTEALNAYSDDYADYNISEMIDDIDDIDDFAESYSELYDLWSKGSGDILFDMDMDVDELPDDLLDDHEAYIKIVLDDRNQYMADKASEYIKEGKNCLFMVGAAHYSGDNGVDDLLEEMGYTVEKIA